MAMLIHKIVIRGTWIGWIDQTNAGVAGPERRYSAPRIFWSTLDCQLFCVLNTWPPYLYYSLAPRPPPTAAAGPYSTCNDIINNSGGEDRKKVCMQFEEEKMYPS